MKSGRGGKRTGSGRPVEVNPLKMYAFRLRISELEAIKLAAKSAKLGIGEFLRTAAAEKIDRELF